MIIEMKGDLENKYRYSLRVLWGSFKPICTFILLNPALRDGGGVITRCHNFAKDFGCGEMYVVNLFAARAISPNDLFQISDPIGSENDDAILFAVDWSVKTSGPVICAWGNSGVYLNRDKSVLKLLEDSEIKLWCLSKNKSGNPAHPLRLSKNLKPIHMEEPC